MKTVVIVLIMSLQLITDISGKKKPEFYIENEPRSFILATAEEAFSLQFIKWGMSPNEIMSIIEEKYPEEKFPNLAEQFPDKIIITALIKPSDPLYDFNMYKETIKFHFRNDKLYCIVDNFENDISADAKIVLGRMQYLCDKYFSLFGDPDKKNGTIMDLKDTDFGNLYAHACWNAKPGRKYYPETSLTLTYNITGSLNAAQSSLEYILIDNNNEPVALKLMKAIRYSDIDKIKDLLTQETDYDLKYIYPPFEEKDFAEIAVKCGSADIIKLLIAAGWDINQKNNDGYTPLEIAVEADKNEIIEILKHNNATGGSTFFMQGADKYKKKKYKEALNLFEKAIICDGSNGTYYGFKANCYFYLKDYTKAITGYSKTIMIDPLETVAYKYRGLSYYKLNNYDYAYKDFTVYLKTVEDSIIYLARGVISFKNEKYNNALSDFQKASELDHNNPQCFKNRGDTYAKLGNNDLAIRDWEKAIELGYKDRQKLEYMINKLKNGE